jgi:cystathionine beta-lyase family protein involved in aluminum resistance
MSFNQKQMVQVRQSLAQHQLKQKHVLKAQKKHKAQQNKLLQANYQHHLLGTHAMSGVFAHSSSTEQLFKTSKVLQDWIQTHVKYKVT